MPLLQDPLAILVVLMLNVMVAEWLAKLPYLKHLGTALLVILVTAIVANIGLIPASTDTPAIYDGIFVYLAPVSIFYLLLTVHLRQLKKAGKPMVFAFLGGAVGIMLGMVVGMWLMGGAKAFGALFYALGGMFTATYIGGSSNFNALALHYEVNKTGNLYAAAIAADNIATALWMAVTLLLPSYLQRLFPRVTPETSDSEQQQLLNQQADEHINDSENLNPKRLALLIGLGAAGLYVAQIVSQWIPQIPKILILTTLALLLAQLGWVQRLRGVRVLAMFCIYLFLAVIGAYCDLAALLADGRLALDMFFLIVILLGVHALFLFGIGALFKQDWALLAVASQANVGGAASCLALSKSFNRPDLHLPGILAGALGNAVGTYGGLAMAEFLRTWV
ncbi:MAG: DUF819 domain-containing protein [Runella sp.]